MIASISQGAHIKTLYQLLLSSGAAWILVSAAEEGSTGRQFTMFQKVLPQAHASPVEVSEGCELTSCLIQTPNRQHLYCSSNSKITTEWFILEKIYSVEISQCEVFCWICFRWNGGHTAFKRVKSESK